MPFFYTLPHNSGLVCYTLWCLFVSSYFCLFIPSSFPINNLSIYSQVFFKSCILICIRSEWFGIVSGQNPPIFDRITVLFLVSVKMFLTCNSFIIWNIWMKLHRYIEHYMLLIVAKNFLSGHSGLSYLSITFLKEKIVFGSYFAILLN